MEVLRNSPPARRNLLKQSSPLSHRGSPVALAPQWQRTNSTRSRIDSNHVGANHNTKDYGKENSVTIELLPLIQNNAIET